MRGEIRVRVNSGFWVWSNFGRRVKNELGVLCVFIKFGLTGGNKGLTMG